MKCPVCTSPLIVAEYHDIEVDFCPGCKGFWFDEGEINLLPELMHFKAELPDFMNFKATASSEKKYPCPRCRKTLDKISLSQDPDLIIDRCPQGDGLWFDAGEVGLFFQKLATHASQTEDKMIHFLGEVFAIKK